MAKKKDTVIGLLLDATGSMADRKSETLAALNKFLDEMRTNEDTSKATMFLTSFNSGETKTIFDGIPMPDTKLVKDSEYDPNNLTPLYDAVFDMAKKVEGKSKGKKVLFAILTDGFENASCSHTREEVSELIKKLINKEWTFIFLGANIDVWAADRMIATLSGVGNTGSYRGSASAFAAMTNAAIQYTSTNGEQDTNLLEETS